jgi:putative peptide zinc metalloprotease protein
VAIVETRPSVWEVLAGRAPGQPTGPADPGLWAAVVERLNPARARPSLRPGIEEAHLVSVRGIRYVMLRSPDDGGRACYLRLTPEELELARLMDGTRTVARLVADFVRICGRLSPDQVTRVVADLAANRMLEELPVDAFRRLDRVHRRPWPVRVGRGLLATARGQRMVLANVDPLVGFLYRAGGRLFFTRPVAVLCGLVALAGLGVFGWTWWLGNQSVFLTNGSYATGALVLLGLNVLALTCHEFGHALAAKHARRRVPVAGFLVYFGIPSVFVDTTDVWMAGRRARIMTTAAGPATGLVLAGATQLVGIAFPELAPWTFKLSFAWYLNALFNLNPFLALDGYYLLMDWVEVPNLRTRGLAWVVARLRRRPPRWRQLDREGRLVALYGVLAVLWLAVAANLAYRIYADRVSGLVVGLWRGGWAARALILAVVAGLASPVVYGVLRWLGSLWHRSRRWWGARRLATDVPRRLDALRSSALGRLPVSVLSGLAASAAWVRPRTGEQVVSAGAAQPSVFVVVNGALEARRPGDPSGTVRQRVGPGGVVGLANALTGAPASLAWLTAGTTLLSVPAMAVAEAIGPLAGPPPADRADLESLLGEAPALSGLSEEDRLGMVSRATPLSLVPGAPLVLAGADDAVLLASGVVVLPDGMELRRGTLIGPAGQVLAGAVATARTSVRAWLLPAMPGLQLLLGSPPSDVVSPGVRPSVGAHPPASYPPLAAPPGPPPSNVDDSADRRFERILWLFVVLLLLLVLLLTGANLIPGPAWAEMRADQALLRVDRGTTVAVVNGSRVALGRGGQVYVASGDSVSVQPRSRAQLTFRGGSVTLLCAGTAVNVGPLGSSGVRPTAPSGDLTLVEGRLLADTASASRAFEPLHLLVGSTGRLVSNDGSAWYGVSSGAAEVSTGTVFVAGVEQPRTDEPLSCGDGATLPRPVGPSVPSDEPTTQSESPSPSLSPSETPSVSPGPSASRSPSPTVSPTRGQPSSTRTNPTPPRTTAPTPREQSRRRLPLRRAATPEGRSIGAGTKTDATVTLSRSRTRLPLLTRMDPSPSVTSCSTGAGGSCLARS